MSPNPCPKILSNTTLLGTDPKAPGGIEIESQTMIDDPKPANSPPLGASAGGGSVDLRPFDRPSVFSAHNSAELGRRGTTAGLPRSRSRKQRKLSVRIIDDQVVVVMIRVYVGGTVAIAPAD